MFQSRFGPALPGLAAALGLLSACQQTPAEAPMAEPSETASEATSGMALENARLVLPAVRGNPGAAYFAIANQSSGTRVISGIEIDGTGKTEVHQTTGSAMNAVDRVEIAPATTMTFSPGDLHVMVFDVSGTLKAGGTTRVRIVFASGEELTGPMKVLSAADAAMGDEHAGMSH